MATKKQIEANRLNARKSTGPSSPEGKKRSSMNALKTGIDSRSQLIRGELDTALSELTREYYDRFRPSTPEQRVFVDTLIDCDWLLRRFRAIETQLWENAYHTFDITLAKAYSKNCDEFSRLQRRIDMTQRHYRNALHELERLQAEELAPTDDPEPLAAPATPQNQTPTHPNGFVPQNAAHNPPEPPPQPSATDSARPQQP